MNVRLEVSHNKANVKRVVLRSDTVIGRSPECNLRIASTEVSRRHCMVILADEGVLVRDLGSSNGTFIDGVQIDPETDVAVAPGSQLSVGGIKFIVHFDAPVLPAREAESGSRESVETVAVPRPPAPPGSPPAAASETVFNDPEQTARDAGGGLRDRTASRGAAIAEPPPTEMFEYGGSRMPDDDDEPTVIEFLPDDPPGFTPPQPDPEAEAIADPDVDPDVDPDADTVSGDDFQDFLRQFEP